MLDKRIYVKRIKSLFCFYFYFVNILLRFCSDENAFNFQSPHCFARIVKRSSCLFHLKSIIEKLLLSLSIKVLPLRILQSLLSIFFLWKWFSFSHFMLYGFCGEKKFSAWTHRIKLFSLIEWFKTSIGILFNLKLFPSDIS